MERKKRRMNAVRFYTELDNQIRFVVSREFANERRVQRESQERNFKACAAIIAGKK